MFGQEFCFYDFKRYSIKTNTFHYNSLLPLQRPTAILMSVKVPYVSLHWLNTTHIFISKEEGKDQEIIQSNTTHDLFWCIKRNWIRFLLKNPDLYFLDKDFLAHQIRISVGFTHVIYFCLTYPYQPMGKNEQPHVVAR